MSTYEEIYTQQGLTMMIENLENKVKNLEQERNDVGLTWTEVRIKQHHRSVNEEIAEIQDDIKELKAALQIRIQLNLR
ncbi:hypothetical protein ACFVS2_26660 [Brevibacillus sp. NPDC058079]|uniref:hypothetical protein n=1 Tax=Brevibacillus sp. NPDC058079 TaxID=3346330 RepID=UPI0036EE189C